VRAVAGGGLMLTVAATPGDRGLGVRVVGAVRWFSSHRSSRGGVVVDRRWDVAWRGGEAAGGGTSTMGDWRGGGQGRRAGCRRRKKIGGGGRSVPGQPEAR
jgi:hypothetical protein